MATSYDLPREEPIEWHSSRLAQLNSNCIYVSNRCRHIDYAIAILSIAVYAAAIPVLLFKPHSPAATTSIGCAMILAGVGLTYETTKFYRLWRKEEAVYSSP